METTENSIREAHDHLRATEILYPLGYSTAGILHFRKGEALYDLTAANIELIGQQADINGWMDRHFRKCSPKHGME